MTTALSLMRGAAIVYLFSLVVPGADWRDSVKKCEWPPPVTVTVASAVSSTPQAQSVDSSLRSLASRSAT